MTTVISFLTGFSNKPKLCSSKCVNADRFTSRFASAKTAGYANRYEFSEDNH